MVQTAVRFFANVPRSMRALRPGYKKQICQSDMRLGIVLEIPSSLSESATPALTLIADDVSMSYVDFPCQGQSLHAGN